MCVRSRSSKRVSRTGSGLIETVAGCMIIIPILLFLVDCAAVVVAQTSNDALAKHACRAAAECTDAVSGAAAATAVITQYNSGHPTLTTNAQCTTVGSGTGGWQDVKVNTTLTVVMPVPIPFSGINNLTFQAQAAEPVVSQLSQ